MISLLQHLWLHLLPGPSWFNTIQHIHPSLCFLHTPVTFFLGASVLSPSGMFHVQSPLSWLLQDSAQMSLAQRICLDRPILPLSQPLSLRHCYVVLHSRHSPSLSLLPKDPSFESHVSRLYYPLALMRLPTLPLISSRYDFLSQCHSPDATLFYSGQFQYIYSPACGLLLSSLNSSLPQHLSPFTFPPSLPPYSAPIPRVIITIFLCPYPWLSWLHALSSLLGKTTTWKSISANWV